MKMKFKKDSVFIKMSYTELTTIVEAIGKVNGSSNRKSWSALNEFELNIYKAVHDAFLAQKEKIKGE